MKTNTYKPDCVIVTDDVTIPFHKTMLLLSSDYFDSYFTYNDGSDKVRMEAPGKIVQLIADYVYTRKTTGYYTEEEYEWALNVCDRYLFSDEIVYYIYRKKETFKRDPLIKDKKDDDIYILHRTNLKNLDYYDVWTPSLCSKGGHLQHNESIRTSLSYHYPNIHFPRSIYRLIHNSNNNSNNESYEDYNMRYSTIIKYSKGSEFKEHVDQPSEYPTGKSCGKILLIHFSDDAIGGHLIVEGIPVVTPLDGTKVWHYYYLMVGIKHSVSMVERGERYCIAIPCFDEDQDYYINDDDDEDDYNDDPY
jgi:hypothetical protein